MQALPLYVHVDKNAHMLLYFVVTFRLFRYSHMMPHNIIQYLQRAGIEHVHCRSIYLHITTFRSSIHLCDAMVDSHDGDAGDTEGDSHDAVMMTINLDVPSHLSSFCLFT